jgi:cob(I)alamin adenosyltransferase
MKIYTRKGDDGTTGLLGGERVKKHHLRVEAYGTVDELNSHIGLLRAVSNELFIVETLSEIQNRLFTAGSILATAPQADFVIPGLEEGDAAFLEQAIDRMDEKLPELKNFILPGGSSEGAQAHIARCVCRRAERLVVYLNEDEAIDPLIIQYLNRLSDYLFTLARFFDYLKGGREITWAPRNK